MHYAKWYKRRGIEPTMPEELGPGLGILYVLRSQDGYHKTGKTSKSVQARLRCFKTGSPHAHEIVQQFICTLDCLGGCETYLLQAMSAAHRESGMAQLTGGTEWHYLPSILASDLCAECSADVISSVREFACILEDMCGIPIRDGLCNRLDEASNTYFHRSSPQMRLFEDI